MPLKTKFFLLLIALFTLASFNLFAQEDENKKESGVRRSVKAESKKGQS